MVDVEAQLMAVAREVVSEEIDGYPSRVQTLAQLLHTSVDTLWEVLTDPARIAVWFAPVTGDLRVGGRFQIEGNASGEVQECAPPAEGTAHLKITWEFGGLLSWVTVRLERVDPLTTRLEWEHIARTEAAPDPLWKTYGPSATGIGWDQALLGLRLHLDAPDAPRPEDPLAWAAGAEGRRFARGSADAWALAHIADGCDPETARRTADAAYALYAGEHEGADTQTPAE